MIIVFVVNKLESHFLRLSRCASQHFELQICHRDSLTTVNLIAGRCYTFGMFCNSQWRTERSRNSKGNRNAAKVRSVHFRNIWRFSIGIIIFKRRIILFERCIAPTIHFVRNHCKQLLESVSHNDWTMNALRSLKNANEITNESGKMCGVRLTMIRSEQIKNQMQINQPRVTACR